MHITTDMDSAEAQAIRSLMEAGVKVYFLPLIKNKTGDKENPESWLDIAGGQVRINLFHVANRKGNYDNVFVVPRELARSKFEMITTEAKEFGHCRIVCGSQGERLKPFYRSGPLARFKSRDTVVIINANNKGITIVRSSFIKPYFSKSLRTYVATIQNKLLWRGEYGEELPDDLKVFDNAVIAAKVKISCENCHCVHYCK